MLTKPALLLRLEGGVLLVASVLCYRETHAAWWLFAVLLLAPDISLLGYLANVEIGAGIYNVVHTLTGPLALLGYSVASGHTAWLPYGLIWTTHIGMDRVLGFGLKYPTRFNDTHLQHV